MSPSIEDAKRGKFSRTGPAIASAGLALAIFAVTLGGTYVYDDFDVFELDARLRDPSRWGQYWTQSYNGGVDNLYRPLVSMTYAAQWWLHGADSRIDESDAWKYHLVNVLLHAAVSALVAELARRLAGLKLGYVVGLLFAVHPIHVEAVANIVGRAELMCAIGVVGALVLSLRPMTVRRAVAVTGCFLVALLSKEQGMLTPLLLLFLAIAKRLAPPTTVMLSEAKHPAGTRAPKRGREPFSAGTLVLVGLLTWILAAYIVWRESILKFWWDRNFLDWTINPLILPDADRSLMPLVLLGKYASLLLAPLNLSPDYGARVIGWQVDWHGPWIWIGIASLLAWMTWMVIAIRRRDGVTIFALLSLAASYGVVSNFLVLIGVNFAERLMYLPSVFSLLLVGLLMVKLPRRELIPLMIILLILASVRSFTYAKRWNDRLSLYESSLRAQPQAIRLYLLLTSEHLSQGRFDEAETVAARGTEVLPEYWEVWVSRALVAMDQRRFDDAQRFLDIAAQTDRAPLGRITGFMKRLDERRREN